MDIDYKQFLDNFQADVASLVYTAGEGAIFEDKFTEFCIEQLELAEETEGASVCSYYYPAELGKDWKINGYCFRDKYTNEDKKTYYETLDLFITQYRNEYNYTITKDVLTRDINLIKRFINGAFKGHIDYIDPSHELAGLLSALKKQSKDFDRVNIFYLTNGVAGKTKDKIDIKGFEETGFYFQVWDIERFYRLNASKTSREPIEISIKEFMPEESRGIQCLKVPGLSELYECYMAILPGSLLSKLYAKFSSRLLESNVRAFLGQNGKFNKGIKETIRDKPQMFLPYNNGLSATAEHVVTKQVDGQLYITRLDDFQIVNGGQTTASLYHTEKSNKTTDLSKVFVQMKLTVIRDQEQKNIEVPNIARFANSQNKISELDLSSNNAFFLKIEDLSRRKYVVNLADPGRQILWFFERVNGQYREFANRLTEKQEKAFREKNPPQNKFIKSDISKIMNLWELEPWFVAQGSQKNFVQYMKKITQKIAKNDLPGENFYKKLIAGTIIFRNVDELFGRKNVSAIGDTNLKSFAVAYTISYFHYLTGNRLDMWKIYEEQLISEPLQLIFKDLLQFVYDHLVNAAGQTLISEYVKRESSWTALKGKSFDLEKYAINQYLTPAQTAAQRDIENDNDEAENEILLISKISGLGIKFWDGLKIHAANAPFLKEIQFDIWDLLKKLKERRNLGHNEIKTGRKILEMIDQGKIVIDEIRELSGVTDTEQNDLKGIYDKMSSLKKEDWARIIGLGEKTNIFDNLEISNIKAVQRSFTNREKVKEAALVRGYESIGKLKKFGFTF